MIRNGKRLNKRPTKQGSKGKGKEVDKAKPITPALKPSGGIEKEGTCFHCGKTGHWKRNCPKYLEDKKNGVETSTSGIFVIEITLSTSASWVLDNGCSSHICTNVQGLKRSRDLAKGEVDLRVGNGAKLEPKSDKCLFMGYPKETRGYYFYNPSEAKVFVAQTGVFLEKDFISKGVSGKKVELEEIQESQSIDTPMEKLEQETQVVVEEQPTQVEQDQRRSSRIRHLHERYGYLITDQGDVLIMDQDDLVTYQEAITGPESEKWPEAMNLKWIPCTQTRFGPW
ncbi:hypothetical protein KIW84_055817 [Lathyrus oleraceus]|uniref:CCHC-type domain-containing protein n=1 Tax=Pisum sativum TaxID=3888 RepID=A0A9D5AG67_PEA|nr:hypothetical protein KIW84_055817 [Pisum sativum]